MTLSSADRFAELVDAHQPSGGDESPHSEAGELLALVSALRELDFDVSPSEVTRAHQRQRLVAMASVRTRELPKAAEPGRHRGPAIAERIRLWSGSTARAREARPGRRVIAAIAGLSVLVATLGILALLAQNAIPGDALYAFKRGTEQAQLALAGSDREEGTDLLGFASTRLEELAMLLDEPVAFHGAGSGIQAAGGNANADLLMDTMDTMDRQTSEGTNALTTVAVDDEDVGTLRFVAEWGVAQFQTLDDLALRMPEVARTRAEESKDLLQAVVERLDGLAQVIDCNCFGDTSPADALGPIPCVDCGESPAPGTTSAESQPSTPVDPAPDTSAVPIPSVPEPTLPPPTVDPIPPVVPPTVPPVVPPVEGSACVTLGGEAGIIQGGICVPLPIIPPLPPNEGQPCVLVDLPWPLDDILGIWIGGVCVIG